MLLLCCSGGVVWHLCVQERLCLGHCASLCPPYAPVLPMLQSDVAGGAAIYRDGEPGPQARITEAYKAGDQTLEVRANIENSAMRCTRVVWCSVPSLAATACYKAGRHLLVCALHSCFLLHHDSHSYTPAGGYPTRVHEQRQQAGEAPGANTIIHPGPFCVPQWIYARFLVVKCAWVCAGLFTPSGSKCSCRHI